MTETASRRSPSAAGPIAFDNSYARLPQGFFARIEPTPVAAPKLVKFNRALALDMGLDADRLEADAAAIFSGNSLLPGSEPIAMAYAGHQFGQFVPQLGDGRAILLGEVIRPDGARRDIQLKGSGQTPFSRRGDGRAALGPVLREYLVSEAMHALGIPTTRALAAVTTGQPVYRERVLPGAIVTRVAASHIRVGTFQFFAARGDTDRIRILADHVIGRHYPELTDADDRYLKLLDAVAARQAALIARWLGVGFIHGVMNTDNMAVSGETIDFGPCAFMDTYDPRTVFSSIDQTGRYAYGNQPMIGQWNIARLAETLLPLLHETPGEAVDIANDAVGRYMERFQAEWDGVIRAKLGLSGRTGVQRDDRGEVDRAGDGGADAGGDSSDEDTDLIRAFLALLLEQKADFTLAFRRLSDAAENENADPAFAALLADRDAAAPFLARWRERLSRDGRNAAERAAAMRAVNAALIPRNHRIEAAIEAAVEEQDFSLFEAMNTALARPYEDQPAFAAFAEPPKPGEEVLQTFCGT